MRTNFKLLKRTFEDLQSRPDFIWVIFPLEVVKTFYISSFSPKIYIFLDPSFENFRICENKLLYHLIHIMPRNTFA